MVGVAKTVLHGRRSEDGGGSPEPIWSSPLERLAEELREIRRCGGKSATNGRWCSAGER